MSFPASLKWAWKSVSTRSTLVAFWSLNLPPRAKTNHTIASVTCCKTCSQTEGPSPGAPAQLPVGEGEEQPDPKMAGEGCPGWCMPNHSCLFGLQAKNSNPAGDGLRQNCTRCLFLHSGVSIKFYWLLSECRAASCHRSGPGFSRLLSWVQKLASSGEKSSVLTDRGVEEADARCPGV